ncbi:MAG: hypothetical protein PWR24_1798 [Desulfonauticus sp.]|nr:hypothetical protein [Desulfonauticus sp.]
MRLGIIQLNPWINDLKGNASKIEAGVKELSQKGADLVVSSELALIGYPPRDLLLRPGIIARCKQVALKLAQSLRGYAPLLLGTPWSEGNKLFNAALFLEKGQIVSWVGKTLLPNYDVFDEQRYFCPFTGSKKINFQGKNMGITICEDIWNDKEFWKKELYPTNPVEQLARENLDILINLSASPYTLGKQKLREKMLAHLSQKYKFALVYVNQVGANDDLIFAGRSMVWNGQGEMIFRAKSFAEHRVVVDLQERQKVYADNLGSEEEIFQALVLGVRDYVHKCGFDKVVLGLSGGIDSSLTAVIATRALGREKVLGVLMPSPFTSKESIEDALELAKNLGIKTYTLPIDSLMQAFDKVLAEVFSGLPRDVTEENIQSRIRGNLLMAISNKLRALLLTTGNKSELAVGYCTIYGDMSGGLAVISDLPKTMVYKVSHWVNREKEIIPSRVLSKPPTAELAPNQRDEDSLPPYELLDEILKLIIEENREVEEIVSLGYAEEVVKKVYRMVRLAEFKRKQAPPGLKITDRAFGTGWRMPIAAKL